MYKGVEVFKGTKAEAEKMLKEYFENSKKGGLEKYLDEVLERRKIFLKWAEKFEKKFHHHFDGEFTIGKLSNRDATQVLKGTGGHNHSVIGKNVQVRKYLTQPVDDLPFDALIEVRYKQGKWIEKQAKSSMFPKNWNIERVKEEIALVYEQMVKEGFDLKWENNKYFGTSSTGFEIQIEVDKLGNLTNAFPYF